VRDCRSANQSALEAIIAEKRVVTSSLEITHTILCLSKAGGRSDTDQSRWSYRPHTPGTVQAQQQLWPSHPTAGHGMSLPAGDLASCGPVPPASPQRVMPLGSTDILLLVHFTSSCSMLHPSQRGPECCARCALGCTRASPLRPSMAYIKPPLEASSRIFIPLLRDLHTLSPVLTLNYIRHLLFLSMARRLRCPNTPSTSIRYRPAPPLWLPRSSTPAVYSIA
jgi:hypothetical protein